MSSMSGPCEIRVDIVGGEIMQTIPACAVMRLPNDLCPTILDRPDLHLYCRLGFQSKTTGMDVH